MQENNNFETIISKWRRMSDVEKIERKENLEAKSMSGDSNHAPFMDHKKDEASLLVPENKASTSVAIIGAGAATATEISSDKTRIEEKQDLIKHEEESKDASGDRDKSDDDYLDNEKVIVNAPDLTKDKPGDNVDSVFLRSPPPHKRQSAPPANEEEEGCGNIVFAIAKTIFPAIKKNYASSL